MSRAVALAGGAADKIGNRYERGWAVYYMLDVLCGRAESIRIEVPGQIGEGFEFRVLDQSGELWVQCKHGSATWTLAELKNKRVLRYFGRKLAEGGRPSFVSNSDATALGELAQRARDSEDWGEYVREFLAGKGHTESFSFLEQQWGLTQADLYEALKRVDVRSVDETSLRRWLRDRLETLIVDAPDTAHDVLSALADESIHQELHATEIRLRLDERGLQLRNDESYSGASHLLDEINTAYLDQNERTWILGHEIRRDETATICALLRSGRDVMLAGPAGEGKTSVVAATVRAARDWGWPVLALRADRLSDNDTPGVLGRRLGLEPTPPDVLSLLAGGGSGLLVIDQLDAVSVVSGRHSERFDVIADLLKRAASHPGVRILLACRRFDLDNDSRLGKALDARRLTSEIVETSPLPDGAVAEILHSVGAYPKKLPRSLRVLLRTPLNLAIYCELAHADHPGIDSAGSLVDLYDKYWDHKERVCREHREGQSDWTGVIDRLCEVASETEELSIPRSRLDDFTEQVSVMASEGVLVKDQGRVGFFHETFYDYCFARRFLGRGHRLREFLTASEQVLFRRSQVRQVLAYERHEAPDRYVADLQWLLASDDVRMHILDTVLAGLRARTDPTEQVWRCLERVIADPTHRALRKAWAVLVANPAWFPFADSSGVLARALHSPDQVDWAARSLQNALRHHPDRVASVIRPFLGRSDDWNRRIGAILDYGDVSGGRSAVDLLLDTIRFDPNRSYSVALKSLARSGKHAWLIEVAALLLSNRFEAATQDDDPPMSGARSIGRSDDALGLLAVSGREEPRVFVEHILPIVIAAMTRYQRPDWPRSPLIRDAVWGFHVGGPDETDLPAILLAAMADALTALAVEEPDVVDAAIERLVETQFYTAHVLVAQAYAAAVPRLADTAIDWLTTTPGSFELGAGSSLTWRSQQLIAAATMHCSDDRLSRLSDALLYYTPHHEQRPLRVRGDIELFLLRAIAPSRQSRTVRMRIEELVRKLGPDIDDRPGPIYMTVTAQSPIPRVAAQHMTDKNWLSAMSRYASESSPAVPGGAYELAIVLAEEADLDPTRFANLALRIPPTANPIYLKSIVKGVVGKHLESETLTHLAAHVYRQADPELDEQLLLLIESNSQHLPHTMITLATHMAPGRSYAPFLAPAQDRANTENQATRRRATRCLAMLLQQDATHLASVQPALDELACDDVDEVRAETIFSAMVLLRGHDDIAWALFDRAATGDAPAVLGSEAMVRYLNAVGAGAYVRLAPLLGRMLAAGDRAKQTAVWYITSASLEHRSLDVQVDEFIAHGGVERVRAVEVFANRITTPVRRDRALSVVTSALTDSDPAVRNGAAQSFQTLTDIPGSLRDYERLFLALAATPAALTENAVTALNVLERADTGLPDATLTLCEALCAAHGADLADFSSAASADAYAMTKVILMTYANSGDDQDVRARCLDLIDRLVGFDAGAIGEQLAQSERLPD